MKWRSKAQAFAFALLVIAILYNGAVFVATPSAQSAVCVLVCTAAAVYEYKIGRVRKESIR